MPKDPLEKLVDRPKRKRFFKQRTPAWLVLEPNRIGMAGGAVAATLALVFYFFRQVSGHEMPPERVLIGAAATFVVGYGAFGIFTWYLLWVAEQELPIPEEEYRIVGIPGTRGEGDPAQPQATDTTVPPTPSEEV